MKDLSTRQKIGWGLVVAFVMFMIYSAYGKLIDNEETVKQFSNSGLDGWTIIIGIGEAVSAALLLIPKTIRLGAVLLSAYFGGAIMLLMSNGQSFLIPAAFLILTWIITSIKSKGFIFSI